MLSKWFELFERIETCRYVVQRNWEGEEGHDDLDLFVATEHYQLVLAEAEKFDNVDVRREGDGYYPVEIEEELLAGFCVKKVGEVSRGVEVSIVYAKLPTPRAHFLSLYYHNAVHKEGDPYREKLRELFLEAYPPMKCDDPGVGYFV